MMNVMVCILVGMLHILVVIGLVGLICALIVKCPLLVISLVALFVTYIIGHAALDEK